MKSLVVDRENLKHNIKIIKKIAEDTGRNDEHKTLNVIGVVKGNGYGLGIIEYSKILMDNGINTLAVSTVEEAIKLREKEKAVNILMLSSTAIKKEIQTLIENDIILSIGSKEAGDIAEEIAVNQKKQVRVHIKIDTGFGRYGFRYDEKEKMIEAIKEWKNLKIEGTFSHCSLAFYEKDKFSQKQFDRFIDCIEFLKENSIETGVLHFCNSSAFLKYKGMRLNAVRVGSAFLGRLSIPNIYDLKNVAYLKSNVAEIKTLPKGYNIGYSNSYTTPKEMQVATIPVGYADGFNVVVGKDMFRKRDKLRYIIRDIKDALKKKDLYVEINGEKCKVLGRLGMYHVTVDITGKNININDEVKLNVNPIFVDSGIRREYK